MQGVVATGMRVVPRGSVYSPGYSAYPHAFQWAHRSELDKGQNVSTIVTSRQAFNAAKPKLDREMGRSRLLCMNCGHVETQVRQRAPSAALLGMRVRVVGVRGGRRRRGRPVYEWLLASRPCKS